MHKIILISLFFLISLLSCNCSATGLIDCEGSFTYVAADFTEEEQGWIEESAYRWNEWVGYVVIKVRPGYLESCSIHNGPTNDTKAIGQANDRTYVITLDKEHMKRINNLNKIRFEAVVMHELGHALGYHHITNGPALMAPSGADDFTNLDRAACVAHNMCKPISED